jgi:hypothetical protein
MVWLYFTVLAFLIIVNIVALIHLVKTRKLYVKSFLPISELHTMYIPIRSRLRSIGAPVREPIHELLAVIVEPRAHHNLIPVIKNMMKKVSNIWVLHGLNNKDMLRTEFKGPEFKDAIHCIELPVENLSMVQYNCLMTMPEFYEMLPAKHILVFQCDSCIFEKSKVKLEDFYKYDYVGAPFITGGVGNGGLSLRRREKMIKITKEYDFLPRYKNEDLYFYDLLRRGEGKLPSDDVAAKCFFEHIGSDELPFGAHKYVPKKHLGLISKDELSILNGY